MYCMPCIERMEFSETLKKVIENDIYEFLYSYLSEINNKEEYEKLVPKYTDYWNMEVEHEIKERFRAFYNNVITEILKARGQL